jgi:hypothetical protein
VAKYTSTSSLMMYKSPTNAMRVSFKENMKIEVFETSCLLQFMKSFRSLSVVVVYSHVRTLIGLFQVVWSMFNILLICCIQKSVAVIFLKQHLFVLLFFIMPITVQKLFWWLTSHVKIMDNTFEKKKKKSNKRFRIVLYTFSNCL